MSDEPASSAGPRLLGPADVRRLAEQHGVRPTKQRGQNFVIDPNTVRRIVRTAGVASEDVVLEVGPGLGSLTLGLVQAGAAVVAVEVDAALAVALPATLREYAPQQADRVHVLRADALRVTDLPGPPPTLLVANLPYNVAVPVLLHLLEQIPTLRSGLVMVQVEVAHRLAAGPGSRTYGIPSVKAGWYAETKLAGLVGRQVFWPVPNVDSALLALDRREPPATSASRAQVFTVVDAAFAQRRKGLRAALAGVAGSPASAEAALRRAGVDPRARGESLDLASFVAVTEALVEAAPTRLSG